MKEFVKAGRNAAIQKDSPINGDINHAEAFGPSPERIAAEKLLGDLEMVNQALINITREAKALNDEAVMDRLYDILETRLDAASAR